jgi:hypothetical protein
MKASLVGYNGRELYKKLELKIVKYGYVRGYPKRPVFLIGSLKVLGLIGYSLKSFNYSLNFYLK